MNDNWTPLECEHVSHDTSHMNYNKETDSHIENRTEETNQTLELGTSSPKFPVEVRLHETNTVTSTHYDDSVQLTSSSMDAENRLENVSVCQVSPSTPTKYSVTDKSRDCITAGKTDHISDTTEQLKSERMPVRTWTK